MQYTRTGLTLTVTAPSEAVADTLARLFSTWPDPVIEPSNDLGNLTEYNAARDALKQQHDYWQEQINEVNTATDPDAQRKIDAAKAQRDLFAAMMRQTARPELPAED